ncbi:MAG TPA: exopolysaccharide biosynthesis polyprenyl glycosylphosphotransferase [Acetobacteraceae bacterium]|nr:exopolysaccharide biosynthesis polyprenyl glycosylphosphotransferase [Acetobacteraceae bacterium]
MFSAERFTGLNPGESRSVQAVAVADGDNPVVGAAMQRQAHVKGVLRDIGDASGLERRLGWLDPDQLPPFWLSSASAVNGTRTGAALRRIADILLSLCLLLFTLPLMIATAAAVRFDSPGPILYRQQRVGLGGAVFTVFKFRSMVADAEAATGPAWATRRDPRVTRVGYYIRLTRIDELPQLINVLRGDMSFIGPRPERPNFVETLGHLIPHYLDRHVIKPGLTGWAQVNYAYGASVDDARAKLAFDLYYIMHRGVLLDIRILLATVRVILFREGAR